jgi:hypothetical protein
MRSLESLKRATDAGAKRSDAMESDRVARSAPMSDLSARQAIN